MPGVTSLSMLFLLLALCPLDVAGYNTCRRNPCQNGGRCVDNLRGFGYHCICPRGLSGQNCQIGQNACRINPCQNGGSCVNNRFGLRYICICPRGFSGQNCQIGYNTCRINTCMNGGSCIDNLLGFGYHCNCSTGFSGQDCQINIDDCASGPCNNNGTCVDQVNGFTCQCAEGFTGDTCDTNIDECASGPCNNNGTCVIQVNGFTCQCAEGFTGVTCERSLCRMVDQPSVELIEGNYENVLDGVFYSLPECKDLCLSMVSCDNIIFQDMFCVLFKSRQGYLPGTPAFNISFKICPDTDECASGPCNNNGTCVDLANGYACQCAEGFMGVTCDITGP